MTAPSLAPLAVRPLTISPCTNPLRRHSAVSCIEHLSNCTGACERARPLRYADRRARSCGRSTFGQNTRTTARSRGSTRWGTTSFPGSPSSPARTTTSLSRQRRTCCSRWMPVLTPCRQRDLDRRRDVRPDAVVLERAHQAENGARSTPHDGDYAGVSGQQRRCKMVNPPGERLDETGITHPIQRASSVSEEVLMAHNFPRCGQP